MSDLDARLASMPDPLREAFEAIDEDGDGTLTADELERVLRRIDPTSTPADAAKLMAQLDDDCSGEITFDEFKSSYHLIFGADGTGEEADAEAEAAAAAAAADEEALRDYSEDELRDLRAVFDFCDSDEDGELSREEMEITISHCLGRVLTVDEQATVKEVFGKGDSPTIGFVEFVLLMGEWMKGVRAASASADEEGMPADYDSDIDDCSEEEGEFAGVVEAEVDAAALHEALEEAHQLRLAVSRLEEARHAAEHRASSLQFVVEEMENAEGRLQLEMKSLRATLEEKTLLLEKSRMDMDQLLDAQSDLEMALHREESASSKLQSKLAARDADIARLNSRIDELEDDLLSSRRRRRSSLRLVRGESLMDADVTLALSGSSSLLEESVDELAEDSEEEDDSSTPAASDIELASYVEELKGELAKVMAERDDLQLRETELTELVAELEEEADESQSMLEDMRSTMNTLRLSLEQTQASSGLEDDDMARDRRATMADEGVAVVSRRSIADELREGSSAAAEDVVAVVAEEDAEDGGSGEGGGEAAGESKGEDDDTSAKAARKQKMREGVRKDMYNLSMTVMLQMKSKRLERKLEAAKLSAEDAEKERARNVEETRVMLEKMKQSGEERQQLVLQELRSEMATMRDELESKLREEAKARETMRLRNEQLLAELEEKKERMEEEHRQAEEARATAEAARAKAAALEEEKTELQSELTTADREKTELAIRVAEKQKEQQETLGNLFYLAMTLRDTFMGDYLGLRDRDALKDRFVECGGDRAENLLFAGIVDKLHVRNKAQKRVLVITDKALYNILPRNLKVKRRIALEVIHSIHACFVSGALFALRVPAEYDYLYSTARRTEIVSVLMEAYEALASRPLSVSFVRTIRLFLKDSSTRLVAYDELKGSVRITKPDDPDAATPATA